MAVEIAEVLDRYNVQPKGRERGGETPYMCPVGHKSFDVNFAKGKWKCFHQCNGCSATGGNSFAMWNMLNGLDPNIDMKPHYKQFCEEFNANSVEHAVAVKLAEQAREAAPVENPKASADTCDKTYRAFLELCKLTQAHRADLAKRGFSPKQVKHYGFKSLPQIGTQGMCKQLQEAGCELKGVPGFYIRSNGKWDFLSSGSGYFIPYKDAENRVIGLQVRYDINIEGLEGKELKTAKQRRYRWTSSSCMDNGTAMPLVPYLGEPRGDDKAVYITEGGLKAMAAASISKRWFAAIPGISCYTVYQELLTYLKSKGITTIVDAWDTDRNTNDSVMNSIKRLYEIAEQNEFKVVRWDAFMNGDQKGCDDYLLQLRIEKALKKTM